MMSRLRCHQKPSSVKDYARQAVVKDMSIVGNLVGVRKQESFDDIAKLILAKTDFKSLPKINVSAPLFQRKKA